MEKYKVITDEDFFNEFKYMSERVSSLGGLFQNEGTETHREEIIEWLKIYNTISMDLEALKENSLGRLREIK